MSDLFGRFHVSDDSSATYKSNKKNLDKHLIWYIEWESEGCLMRKIWEFLDNLELSYINWNVIFIQWLVPCLSLPGQTKISNLFFLDKKKSPKCIISISRDCKETRQRDLIDQQTLRFDVDWLVLTSYETDRDRRHVSPQWWGICSAR